MKITLIAIVAALLILPAHAEEKSAVLAKSSWSDFLKNLKNTLSKSAVGGERKKGRSSQAVAAVRGEEQVKKNISDLNEPFLKGDSKSVKARKETGYDMVLEGAVDQLTKGDIREGLKVLETFQAKHAKYRAADVNKAIEGAKAMIAEKIGTPTAPAAAQ